TPHGAFPPSSKMRGTRRTRREPTRPLSFEPKWTPEGPRFLIDGTRPRPPEPSSVDFARGVVGCEDRTIGVPEALGVAHRLRGLSLRATHLSLLATSDCWPAAHPSDRTGPSARVI